MISAMYRFSKDRNLYPTQLFLKNPPKKLGDQLEAGGSFGEVYKIPFQGKDTYYKVAKIRKGLDSDRFAKAFAKEAVLWAQLSHQNILPFYGLARINLQLVLVMPWAANGNLENYLSQNRDADRLLLCADTAAGMEYLHQNEIIHGNLRGSNVLIDSCGRAALGDFGISSVSHTEILKWTTESAMASKGGTVRWQAPELFMDQEDQSRDVCNTKESDVFAWAGVCYEVNAHQPNYFSVLNLQQIFTGHIPYHGIMNQTTVMLRILQGKKPTCPEESDAAWHQHGLTQQMWGLMEECWAFQASKRPSASEVVAKLKQNTGPDTREPGEWADGVTMRSRRGEEAGDVRDVKFWDDLESLLTRIVRGLEEGNTT
ncbi:hypothetical protein C0993_010043 [Termitomyces sp. T159_Od127]|nr:hypothetical protein C0993_010043 [Termitomyces sp. T159_Od127]